MPKLHFFTRSRSFWYGATLPLEALKLILTHKSLLLLSILPILITALLYVYGIMGLQNWAHQALDGLFVRWGLSPESSWFTVIRVVEWIFFAVIAAVSFSISTALVAAPFNDFLAEKTEPLTTPPLPPAPKKPFIKMLKVIWIDLIKSIAAGAAFVVSLIFLIVPFLNIVGIAVGFLVVAYQYTNYPQSRRDIGLKQSLGFLWKHLFGCLGFGMTVSLMISIPFVSILCLPIAVVGGTLLFSRAQDPHAFPLK